MKISVIIPTYNRGDVLLEALDYLKDQSMDKKDYEVIIINDGSADHTSMLVDKYMKEHNDMNIKYFEQSNSGPSKARNLGIKHSSGKIVVLIGDDTLCPKDFLKSHIRAHKEENFVITGPQIWTEKPNEFMNLLVDNESAMKRRNNLGIGGFCTANVSIEKKWLMKEKFDENFKMGFEDSELGYRLIKKGVRMIFDPSTKVYHKHYYNLEAFRKKQKMHGKGVTLFIKKHPELKNQFIPKYMVLKRALCRALVSLGIFQWMNTKFYAHMEYLIHYVNGIEEGVKEFNIKL